MPKSTIISRFRVFVAYTCAALACSCGGSSSSSTTPSDPGTSTVTITASGVSPKSITVSAGAQVTFVDNDPSHDHHNIQSDPHPEHTDCPEINQVGHLENGQSRQTGNLNTVRRCGFHDHLRNEVAALRGSITIQ